MERYFYAGWLACAATHSLIQDMYGPQAYAAIAVEQWIDPLVTVPLALLTLGVCYFWTRR